jgi:hypothetical protein
MVDPDKVDWIKTIARNSESYSERIQGAPKEYVLLDGTIVINEETKNQSVGAALDSPPPPVDRAAVAEHLNKRRLGRPPGTGPLQKAAAATAAGAAAKLSAPKLSEAIPAGSDPEEEKTEAQEPEPMPSKPRTQTLPGVTGTAANIVRELPLEAIHEAIEQNYFGEGVVLHINYKNARGIPTSLGRTQVSLEALATDLEEWLRTQWGGGCFRIDARDPATGKRALPIPVFEISIHAPQRLMTNGTVLAPGQAPPQGSPMTSGFQNAPWMPAQGSMGGPSMPGNVSVPAAPPWQAFPQAWPAQGAPGVHHVPVMSMPPDQIAMTELQKTQTALERERQARAKESADFTRKLDEVRQTLVDQRLKEEDRARQLDQQAMRDQMRRMEENFRAQLDQERNKKPSFDLGALAAVVTALVPVVTTLISTRNDQAQRSLEMQATGVNNLMTATLDRSDSKWLEKALALAPTMMPLVLPIFKAWAEQRSPTAQADLVATLSENHLTALSMMAKLMNEMVPAGPEQPAWVPVFQQMVGTVVQSIDGMVRSNKNAVGIPTQSRHLPQPQVQVQQQMTPAQIASGMQGEIAVAQPPIVTPLSRGAQVAQYLTTLAEVPADLKTPPFLKLIEDLHNEVSVDEVALYFANHMRELDDNVPQMLQTIWTTDNPEQLFQNLFMNLPIWQWNQSYALSFIRKAADILTMPDAPSATTAQSAAAAAIPKPVDFFAPVAASPA